MIWEDVTNIVGSSVFQNFQQDHLWAILITEINNLRYSVLSQYLNGHNRYDENLFLLFILVVDLFCIYVHADYLI